MFEYVYVYIVCVYKINKLIFLICVYVMLIVCYEIECDLICGCLLLFVCVFVYKYVCV